MFPRTRSPRETATQIGGSDQDGAVSLEEYAGDRIDTILTLSCSEMARATLAGATGNTRYRMAGVWDGSAKCFKQIGSECFFLSSFWYSPWKSLSCASFFFDCKHISRSV